MGRGVVLVIIPDPIVKWIVYEDGSPAPRVSRLVSSHWAIVDATSREEALTAARRLWLSWTNSDEPFPEEHDAGGGK